jgi:type III secretion system YscQ/HrcQ family protein
MGMQETISKALVTKELRFDWVAFRGRLPMARAGQPPQSRRVVVPLGGDSLASVSLQDGAAWHDIETEAEEFETCVSFGAEKAHLRAPWQLVQALVDASGIAQDCRPLSAQGLSLVTESLLAVPAHALETVFGGSLRIWPEAAGDRKLGAQLVFVIALSGKSFAMTLDTTEATARRLKDLFPPVSPVALLTAPPQMPVPLSLLSPAFKMALTDLTSLLVGDVVMLDIRWTPRTAQLVAGKNIPMGEVNCDQDSGLVTLSAMAPRLSHDERNEPMLSQPQASDARPSEKAENITQYQFDGPMQATLEHLAITVSVELDHAEMTLGELCKLSLGCVLPFEGEVGERVRVLANGEPFARGELVRIGEGTGVRLLSLD